MNEITISGDSAKPLKLPEIIHKGQRVITLAMMDAVHERSEGTARRNFNANKDKITEGEDYFTVSQPDEIRTLGLARADGGTAASITLLTETGYLTLVRSFTDDLAWKVQKQLVKGYFKAKQMSPAELLVMLAQQNLQIEREQKRQAEELAKLGETVSVLEARTQPENKHFTVMGYANLVGLKLDITAAAKLGKKCANLSREQGLIIGDVRDPRFGKVHSYHESILETVVGSQAA